MSDDLRNLVNAAIDEVNADIGESGPNIEKDDGFPLLGQEGGVDSLTFVNLIVAIEGQIQARLNRPIILVSERTLASEEHPFRTVGTLVAYVQRLLT